MRIPALRLLFVCLFVYLLLLRNAKLSLGGSRCFQDFDCLCSNFDGGGDTNG
jgi:hypothetical protein